MTQEEIIKDIMLSGFKQDAESPIIYFKRDSDLFKVNLMKPLYKSKLVSHPNLYAELVSNGILVKELGLKGTVYRINSDSISSMIFEMSNGWVKALEVRIKGKVYKFAL